MANAPTPQRGGTNLATLRQAHSASDVPASAAIRVGLDTVGGFEALQRQAQLFAGSTIVPDAFRGSPSNCAIALNMALRMGADPMSVMQNLYIVHGKPSWSASFLIATFNKTGRFTSLKFSYVGKFGQDDFGCCAYATELATGERIQGPYVTVGIAKKEGWYGKSGSKWPSMTEQMLRYRAASWFIRTCAPEVAMGLHTVDEVRDGYAEDVPAACLAPERATVTVEATAEPAEEKAKPAPKAVQKATAKPAAEQRPVASRPAKDAQPMAMPASVSVDSAWEDFFSNGGGESESAARDACWAMVQDGRAVDMTAAKAAWLAARAGGTRPQPARV